MRMRFCGSAIVGGQTRCCRVERLTSETVAECCADANREELQPTASLRLTKTAVLLDEVRHTIVRELAPAIWPPGRSAVDSSELRAGPPGNGEQVRPGTDT